MTKLLCFHGFGTNSNFLRYQLEHSSFLSSFEHLVEFDVLNGRHRILKNESVPPRCEPPFYVWWQSKKTENGSYDYEGWTETLDYVESYCRTHGPFDGLLGFSQGACLASVLIGLQQRGLCLKDIPPFKFVILVAGFPSRFPDHQEAYRDLIQRPSLHISGEGDDIRISSRLLEKTFRNPVVVDHPGGHSFPKLNPKDKETIQNFIIQATNNAKM